MSKALEIIKYWREGKVQEAYDLSATQLSYDEFIQKMQEAIPIEIPKKHNWDDFFIDAINSHGSEKIRIMVNQLEFNKKYIVPKGTWLREVEGLADFTLMKHSDDEGKNYWLVTHVTTGGRRLSASQPVNLKTEKGFRDKLVMWFTTLRKLNRKQLYQYISDVDKRTSNIYEDDDIAEIIFRKGGHKYWENIQEFYSKNPKSLQAIQLYIMDNIDFVYGVREERSSTIMTEEDKEWSKQYKQKGYFVDRIVDRHRRGGKTYYTVAFIAFKRKK